MCVKNWTDITLRRFRWGFLCLVLCSSVVANAQTRTNLGNELSDPRGEPEITLCTQNLDNYGTYRDAKRAAPELTPNEYVYKQRALLRRFLAAGCDIIAVQEVLGSGEDGGKAALQELADLFRKVSNRRFQVDVGPSNDKRIRQGFLTATDRVEVMNKVSYARVELPKIAADQKPRLFSRGPLELQLKVKPRGEGASKILTVINFHFKSKSTRGGTDPAGLEFEPVRMEMAEALRRTIEYRHEASLAEGKTLLAVVGDRNSNYDSASAEILTGTLTLADFQGTAPCRLSKRGLPLCHPGLAKPAKLFSVFRNDPDERYQRGTISYDKVFSWIDDILLPQYTLPTARENEDVEGDFASGVIYDNSEASDHALLWVKLNW